MKEEWLFRGALVPIDAATTSALVAEIKRLIDVVGGMALAQPEFLSSNEANIAQLIEERDVREDILDKVLDMVLGIDRPEWSSSYQYIDAVEDVREALAQPNEFNPDWDAMAVMVQEQQRMARRIEELEALLTRKTARIVDLQTHIENLEGEQT